MSEKKTIQVNPDLFVFTSNKTRKKREPGSEPKNKIKIKEMQPKSRNDTLKKRSLLRMIRAHQEENYKKLFQNNEEKKPRTFQIQENNNNFDSDFEQSKQYLNKLLEETNNKEKINRTLKNYPNETNSLLYSNIELPNLVNENNNIVAPKENIPYIISPRPTSVLTYPQYGCLKGGNLPTYRNWLNKTVKNNSVQPNSQNQQTIQPPSQNYVITNPTNILSNFNPINTTPSITIGGNNQQNKIDVSEMKLNDNLKRVSEIKQTMNRLQLMKNKNMDKKMKQKKTIRRTYKIGKSKVIPRISVLVSNKTIRNKISTQKQLLKQVPIQDVKKYLIKRGFIKIGSIAPNDILRKMYESSILICGEVQNHNPDNLLYNFLNGQDDK
jgi:hypothetical protein